MNDRTRSAAGRVLSELYRREDQRRRGEEPSGEEADRAPLERREPEDEVGGERAA
jgi:hypothetical protein